MLTSRRRRLEPPLHVANDEWAATLEDVGEASAFESDLDLFVFEARTGRQTWSAATTERTYPSCPSPITASGDTRIWHRKVEDWVRSLHPPEAISKEQQTPILRRRTDLVEALMSHGILRDNDMRVLSEDGHSPSMIQSNPGSPASPIYVDSVGESSPQPSSDDGAIGEGREQREQREQRKERE